MAYIALSPAENRHAETLGAFEAVTDTRNLLTETLPIWQTLLLAIGGLALLVWGADTVKRETKRARKSLGV
jgi:hypothetical protein